MATPSLGNAKKVFVGTYRAIRTGLLMFGRKHKAKKLATDLIAIFADSKPVVDYVGVVQITDAEQERLMFTALLAPIVISYFFAVAQKYGHLQNVVRESHDLILSGLHQPDRFVKLGDYIVWSVERRAFLEHLEKYYDQRISDSTFAAHEVRYGFLARVALAIRERQILADMTAGCAMEEQLEGSDVERSLQCMAITFSKQVIEIAPEEVIAAGEKLRRFQLSCFMAGQILTAYFLRVPAILRAI